MTPQAGTVSEHTPLRFLDPAVLARISTLELVARTVVEGFISGLHRSPYLGFSVDFAQYRQYIEGDDIRQIDWKVYARSDRHYVKQYEGETSTNVYLLLDIFRLHGLSLGFRHQDGVRPLSHGQPGLFRPAPTGQSGVDHLRRRPGGPTAPPLPEGAPVEPAAPDRQGQGRCRNRLREAAAGTGGDHPQARHRGPGFRSLCSDRRGCWKAFVNFDSRATT